ncbi:MAG: hypothetical protein FJ104_11190 [Deltaproteobacteria bacterium]|nr:hypothetical protein [Deltaproteobacteria bacterium]
MVDRDGRAAIPLGLAAILSVVATVARCAISNASLLRSIRAIDEYEANLATVLHGRATGADHETARR